MKNYINIHTHRTKGENLELFSLRLGSSAESPSTLLYSAGIHPWDIDEIVDFEILYNELRTRKIVAVGEIGLDYSRGLDKELQAFVFEKQVAIAKELNLPIIIHCVKSYNKVLNTLLNNKIKKAIFHSFIGSSELAKQVCELGYYLSFSPLSLGSPKSIEALQNMPLDKLFIETDDSEQSIESVYEQVAEHLAIDIDKLTEIIHKNYMKLFR